jgi:hypothetical protein
MDNQPVVPGDGCRYPTEDMRRISLFATVFVVPALIAIVLATWAHRSRVRRSEALDMFDRALAAGQTLPVDLLFRTSPFQFL